MKLFYILKVFVFYILFIWIFKKFLIKNGLIKKNYILNFLLFSKGKDQVLCLNDTTPFRNLILKIILKKGTHKLLDKVFGSKSSIVITKFLDVFPTKKVFLQKKDSKDWKKQLRYFQKSYSEQCGRKLLVDVGYIGENIYFDVSAFIKEKSSISIKEKLSKFIIENVKQGNRIVIDEHIKNLKDFISEEVYKAEIESKRNIRFKFAPIVFNINKKEAKEMLIKKYIEKFGNEIVSTAQMAKIGFDSYCNLYGFHFSEIVEFVLRKNHIEKEEFCAKKKPKPKKKLTKEKQIGKVKEEKVFYVNQYKQYSSLEEAQKAASERLKNKIIQVFGDKNRPGVKVIKQKLTRSFNYQTKKYYLPISKILDEIYGVKGKKEEKTTILGKIIIFFFGKKETQ